MQKRLTTYTPFLLTLFAMVSLGGCEKPIELNSKWRNFEITIDGKDNEWGGATIYAEKEKVSLTILNDSDYMYIRINSRDHSVQTQVLGMGFTLWFDPNDGKNKTFGIHFPLGMHNIGMPMMAGNHQVNQGEIIQQMLARLTDEMEILGPGEKNTLRISLAEAKEHGINVGLDCSSGNLVYELKVPFVQGEDHLFAIGLKVTEFGTNRTIGIGFETPEIDMEGMKKNMEEKGMGMPTGGSGMPPGGMPGGGMPHGGMPGGEMHGGPEMPKRLQLWTTVKLADE